MHSESRLTLRLVSVMVLLGQGAAQTCTMCPAGKFKDAIGNNLCTDCGQNFYLTLTGQTASTACQTCPGSSISPAGSSTLESCRCPAGFSGADGSSCSQCPIRSYKVSIGSATCTTCPDGSSTLAQGSTALAACTCNTGYTGPNGVNCEQCGAGT